MKQNEKILVYAVTGFLVVILGIAVVFGREKPAVLPGPQEPRKTEVAGGPGSFEELFRSRERGNDAENGKGAPVDATVDGKSGTVSGLPAPSDLVAPQPLTTGPAAAPAVAVADKLGPSRRERDFRFVRARQGDSLSSLVQRWCGGVDGYLEETKALNEDLTLLKFGQEVVVPWVDDVVLLAAYEERQGKRPVLAVEQGGAQPGLANGPAPARHEGSGQVPAVPLSATDARSYTVRAGDSLWKIAEREVGRKEAPRFLGEVRALNSGLDPDRLKVGQKIALPPKKSQS